MIHFSHGNGFPAQTYHQLIKGLKSELLMDVGYISCLGHNPDYPLNGCWSILVDEVIAHVSSTYNQKVLAIGHSLGGVISYWACMRRPDLFNGVIMLDAPFFGYYKLAFIGLLKNLGLLEYVTPARNTRNRRYIWSSYQEALEHFATKKVFKYFDQRCLHDYVYFGTQKISNTDSDANKNDQIKLLFDPIIEWKIYRSMPSLNFDKLPDDIPCGLIYGEFSKVVSDSDANYMAKKYGIWTYKLARCGHLLPFEQPKAVITAIVEFVNKYKLIRDQP